LNYFFRRERERDFFRREEGSFKNMRGGHVNKG